ncbi:hypothetical protein AA0243_2237 [Novacetimonas hansenii NRIC 0243]|nr:hypothetical protein AA0243_2237 [Novacetimonas hansenii NRIC 0243]
MDMCFQQPLQVQIVCTDVIHHVLRMVMGGASGGGVIFHHTVDHRGLTGGGIMDDMCGGKGRIIKKSLYKRYLIRSQGCNDLTVRSGEG